MVIVDDVQGDREQEQKQSANNHTESALDVLILRTPPPDHA